MQIAVGFILKYADGIPTRREVEPRGSLLELLGFYFLII